MTSPYDSVKRLSDDQLITKIRDLARTERGVSIDLLVHLWEMDRRKLAEELAYPSLYIYCTKVLGYAEGAAYRRIHTARAAHDFPVVLDMLKEGRIHMAAVTMLTPHLTGANHVRLLVAAQGKSKRDLETMIACLAPRRELGETVRHVLPRNIERTGTPLTLKAEGLGAAAVAAAASSLEFQAQASVGQTRSDHQSIKPFAPDRIRFAFNGSEEMLRMVERAREILRHKHPWGRLEDIFFDALNALLDKKDPDRILDRRDRRRMQTERRGRRVKGEGARVDSIMARA